MLVAAAASLPLAVAPIASADTTIPRAGDESARATIDDLKSQGYTVRINWDNGITTMPLDQCSVNSIDNDNSGPPTATSLSVVYVDVFCPDSGDDSDN
jgi:hypothetical protein